MEHNYAYITLLSTNDYIYGCIGLIESWKRTNPKYPFYCMVTANINFKNRMVLQQIGYKLIEIDFFCPPQYIELAQQSDLITGHWEQWQYCWNKLSIWQQEQFDKLVYLDSDIWVLKNLDDLFDYPDFSGTPDIYHLTINHKWWLMAALMIAQPNKETFNKLVDFVNKYPVDNDNYLGCDMDIINRYVDYNAHPELMLPCYCLMESTRFNKDYKDYILYNLPNIRAIHLSDKKPWQCDSEYYKQYENTDWKYWSLIHQAYSDFLKKCVEDLHNQNIDVKLW